MPYFANFVPCKDCATCSQECPRCVDCGRLARELRGKTGWSALNQGPILCFICLAELSKDWEFELEKLKPRSITRKAQKLYFVACGELVKIGASVNPDARLGELKTGAPGPLRLLAAISKAGEREHEIHKRLNHLHVHGEWFRYTEEIESLIHELQGHRNV